MISALGWVLLVAALFLVASAFRRPEGAAAGARPNRSLLWGGVLGGLAGLALALWPSFALARMETVDLSRQDTWRTHPATGPEAPVRWDGTTLLADLEAGSNRYAVFPVDWDADRFEASWDITFTHLDRTGDVIPLKEGDRSRPHRRSALDYASLAVGVMDQSVANIDDRDHVGGSAIEACFSDDIRLRASDANYVLRTSSHNESGKKELDPSFRKTEPIRIALNTTYRCRLTYHRPSRVATLEVRDSAGKPVVSRRLEDLKDFTNSVAWFGVSVRGYNRFDKKLDPRKALNGYVRPKAVARLENLVYRQP